MIWGDVRIKDAMNRGLITGAEVENIGPASLDVRLGNTFLVPKAGSGLFLGEALQYDRHCLTDDDWMPIKPGQFMLATTMENITVPMDAAAFVQGRSSIGRIGLTVQNAGFVDPGFYGHITLELVNESPSTIWLRPGYRVAQIVFMDANGVTFGYKGKYNGQEEATESRMWQDREAKEQHNGEETV